jgi:WbqC-like protein family
LLSFAEVVLWALPPSKSFALIVYIINQSGCGAKSGAMPVAPLISAGLSANIYVNPVGGRELFDRAEFTRQGVALQFLDFKPFIYDTPGYKFEENLSMLDVLMGNSPDAIVQAIRENCLLIAESRAECAATGDA